MKELHKAQGFSLDDKPGDEETVDLLNGVGSGLYRAIGKYPNPDVVIGIWADYVPELRRLGKKIGEEKRFYDLGMDAISRFNNSRDLDARLAVICEEAQRAVLSERATRQYLQTSPGHLRILRVSGGGKQKKPRKVRAPTRQVDAGTAESLYLGDGGDELTDHVVEKFMDLSSE